MVVRRLDGLFQELGSTQKAYYEVQVGQSWAQQRQSKIKGLCQQVIQCDEEVMCQTKKIYL